MQEELNSQFDGKSERFEVPGGYFARSAEQIMNRIDWEEEHKAYAKLRLFRNLDILGVPDDYFRKKEEAFELLPFSGLNSQTDKNHFALPEKYFEEGQQRIEFETEIATNYPVLAGLEKTNPFGLENDYFASTEHGLRKRVLGSGPARLLQMFSKRLMYSVAALLLITIGIWFYNYYFGADGLKDCGSMACVDRDEIIKSRNLELLDEEQLYELVDTKELENSLEKKNGIITNEASDSSLNTLSADDILEEI